MRRETAEGYLLFQLTVGSLVLALIGAATGAVWLFAHDRPMMGAAATAVLVASVIAVLAFVSRRDQS